MRKKINKNMVPWQQVIPQFNFLSRPRLKQKTVKIERRSAHFILAQNGCMYLVNL